MPILQGDIKLLASHVMDDVPEGGGGPSGTIIEYGQSNAIFPDISEMDRAGGRVSIRQVFPWVRTDDTDKLMGTNIIVAEAPADPNVSVTLFSTGGVFDTRAQAQARIEAYLNKGPLLPGYLYENHIKGQRVIQLFQRVTDAVPNVGQTIVLVWSEGKTNEVQQYVRATAVSSVTRTFTYGPDSDYQAAIVTISLSDALRTDFTGSPASRTFLPATNGTIVRDTVVADAGSYVGAARLAQPMAQGDLTLRASSIYTQLVPSAQTETPISSVQPYAAAGLPVPGAAPVTYTATHTWDANTDFFLPGGCLPGSLSIVVGGVTVTDAGGLLKTSSGPIGTIDYANGILHLYSGSMSGTKAVTYTPAAQVLRAPQSTEIAVTQESRAKDYVGTILPIAQPGTLSVSYRAQGRWYVLTDDGSGKLSGLDVAYGVGTYNPNTGAYVVSLGSLPDVGSSIILQWGAPTQETQQPVATLKAAQTFTISPPEGKAPQPGSIVLTWNYNGTKTATMQANGSLTGDASGNVWVAQNRITFAPNVLPNMGSIITITYTVGPKHTDLIDHPSRNAQGKVQLTASLGAVTPGSLELMWSVRIDPAAINSYSQAAQGEMGIANSYLGAVSKTARDDGAGNVVLDGGGVIGTIDYSTGIAVFDPDVHILVPMPAWSVTQIWDKYRSTYSGIQWVNMLALLEDSQARISYNSPGSADVYTDSVTFSPSFRLVPEVNAQLVAGAQLLTVSGSQPWGDNGMGLLREYTTSGWVTRGNISYVTGEVALTSWVPGTPNSITRAACVTTVGEAISSEYVFRSATSPLRSGSLSVQFARAAGGTQSVTASVDGSISGTDVAGSVSYEMGLVRVRFGALVTAAGHESEPWYNAANVDANGKIWMPKPVAMSSLRYSAVAYSYLPLDAALLGIDPVRLPSDGRVPIFRPGGFVVIGNTGTINATVSNNQVINCGRTRLSRVYIVGSNGRLINSGYTADLDAGTVTITDCSTWAQPVSIKHRIEMMARMADVQIDGSITITRACTHDFAVAGTTVASALMAGDMWARVGVVFDQQSWDGVTWSDTVIGNPAVASYNTTAYPITVTNRGAITERWALQIQSNGVDVAVIGEHVGNIGTFSRNTTIAPINPISGAPYFTVQAAGWGSGWAAGNILCFGTVGAQYPVWCVRTVQQGQESVNDDAFTLLVRGDVDRP